MSSAPENKDFQLKRRTSLEVSAAASLLLSEET